MLLIDQIYIILLVVTVNGQKQEKNGLEIFKLKKKQ